MTEQYAYIQPITQDWYDDKPFLEVLIASTIAYWHSKLDADDFVAAGSPTVQVIRTALESLTDPETGEDVPMPAWVIRVVGEVDKS